MLWLLSYLPTCLFILRRSLCISRVRFGMSTGPVPTDHAACNVFTDALPRLGSTDIHIYIMYVCIYIYIRSMHIHARISMQATIATLPSKQLPDFAGQPCQFLPLPFLGGQLYHQMVTVSHNFQFELCSSRLHSLGRQCQLHLGART